MSGRVYKIRPAPRRSVPLPVLLLALVAACGHSPPSVRGGASEGLVFVRLRDGVEDLARARIADGAVRAQTETPDRIEWWPYWAPRARRLVFQVRPAGGPDRFDLMLWEPDTARETPLTETQHRDERWPAWSPDGKSLVFAFRGSARPRGGIALLDLDGESHPSAELLARSGLKAFFFRPSFAPDGRRLLAQRRARDGPGSTIWLLERGGEPRQLTHDESLHDSKAWFTRTGAEIVFSREPADRGPREILAMRPDGTGVRPLAPAPDADDHSARPSPTRDELVFVSTRDGSADIFLVNLDGSGLRNLTRSPDREEYTPRWSPDGERIAVTYGLGVGEEGDRSDRPISFESASVAVIDRQGTVVFETAGMMPDWMPAW